MPDAALSAAIREAYASAPATALILHTLEFRHPSFTTPIRVVADTRSWDLRLEPGAPADPNAVVTFVGFAFEFTLPEKVTTAAPEIEIAIDNVDRQIVAYMDLAAQSDSLIEVSYRAYLADDPSGPQNVPPLTLVVREVSADVFRVRARCGFGDLSNRKFPNEVYDLQRFPGLLQL